VLPAIPTEDWSREHLAAYIDEVRRVFEAALDESQHPRPDGGPPPELPDPAEPAPHPPA
jgi:hypothetical protein